jgi:hypothetical protein
MTDVAVPIAAIVVSGVVGPSLGAWWTRSRQHDDHQRDLLFELRAVLDEGAGAVSAAKRRFERIYNLCREEIPREAAEVAVEYAAWREAMRLVDLVEARIAIRLGEDHPVHVAFVAWVATLSAQRQFARAYERGELSERIKENQRTAHAAFEPARRQYIEGARDLVGPRLSRIDTGRRSDGRPPLQIADSGLR